MTFKRVKVPYPMPPAVDENVREELMAWALTKKLPRLQQQPIGDETMTIVGYGPSLADTWQKVKPPLIATSRALKFLIERGMEPSEGWFYAMADPRPNNLEFITPPVKGVTYLMASVCYPKVWSRLAGEKVIMWHAMSGEHTPEWVRLNDPDTLLMGAGSTIGLCAIHLGGCLGFRHFEIHGFDGCFRDGKRHAGEHSGHDQEPIPSVLDTNYTTSRIMDNANTELINTLKQFPIFCVFHGDGLMQSWVRKARLHNAAVDGTPEANVVRGSRFIPISDERARELEAAGVPVI